MLGERPQRVILTTLVTRQSGDTTVMYSAGRLMAKSLGLIFFVFSMAAGMAHASTLTLGCDQISNTSTIDRYELTIDVTQRSVIMRSFNRRYPDQNDTVRYRNNRGDDYVLVSDDSVEFGVGSKLNGVADVTYHRKTKKLEIPGMFSTYQCTDMTMH